MNADSNKGKHSSTENISKESASETMRIIQEKMNADSNKGKHSSSENISTESASETMRRIQEKMNADSNKGKHSSKETMAPTRNLASEKIKMIRDQQQKFANLGKAPENLNDSEVEVDGVKKVANKFGETVKPKTAVQRKREEFERKQKEAAEHNNHKAHIQVVWKKKGSVPNQFSKQTTDSRGIAPKRSILDLP